MRKTLDRQLSYKPQTVYLTHFGRVTSVEKLGMELLQCLDQLMNMALELKKNGEAQQEQLSAGVRKILKDKLWKHNCQLPEKRQDELLSHDYLLNAQGIGVWLEQMEK